MLRERLKRVKTGPAEGLAMDLADMCTEIGRVHAVTRVETVRENGHTYSGFVVKLGPSEMTSSKGHTLKVLVGVIQ